MLLDIHHKSDTRKKIKQNSSSSVSLLGEVGFQVEKPFSGHGIYKGFIIKNLPPKENNRICRIKYKDESEQYITLKELNMSVAKQHK